MGKLRRLREELLQKEFGSGKINHVLPRTEASLAPPSKSVTRR